MKTPKDDTNQQDTLHFKANDFAFSAVGNTAIRGAVILGVSVTVAAAFMWVIATVS